MVVPSDPNEACIVPASQRTREVAESIASQCVGARLRMLNRIVTRTYEDQLRPYGLKFSQMNIMTVVAARGPIAPGEVGRILALEKSTLSRNVRLMETSGWIETLPGESGNTHLLRLTSSGQRLYQRAAAAWQTAQADVTRLLGKQTTVAIHAAVDQARQRN